MVSKITTLHPGGKPGVTMEREKYRQVRAAILGALRETDELSFRELMERSITLLPAEFHGSPSWYVTTVKLDLEARGWIQCTRKRFQTVRSAFGPHLLSHVNHLERSTYDGMEFDQIAPEVQRDLIRSAHFPAQPHL